VWWLTSTISALGRLRKGDQKVSGSVVRATSKNKQTNTSKQTYPPKQKAKNKNPSNPKLKPKNNTCYHSNKKTGQGKIG
jgi:hypothetical protein